LADWPGIGRLAWDWLIGIGLAQIGTDWHWIGGLAWLGQDWLIGKWSLNGNIDLGMAPD